MRTIMFQKEEKRMHCPRNPGHLRSHRTPPGHVQHQLAAGGPLLSHSIP
jgi:hypothetical protein